MRKVISLNDSHWFSGAVAPQPFGSVNDFAEVKGWLPATVPGDVRLDLLHLGKIPDPFLGKNNEASQWVDDYDWWYRREIVLDDADVRTFLEFEGIDYQCAVFWDELELGRHVGMFSRQLYEIPRERATAGTHRLSVRVWGGKQLPRLRLALHERTWAGFAGRFAPHAPHTSEFPERYATLKCQMSYGWDFAPHLLTCGIWDEAALLQTRTVLIRDVWIQGVPDGRVQVTLALDSEKPWSGQAIFQIRPKNFEGSPQAYEFPVRAEATDSQSFALQLASPQVWNPWDRGNPNLYELSIELRDNAGAADSYQTTFGLRTVDLTQNGGAPPDSAPWTFTVNGRDEFVRGANWVPADAIPARVLREDYAELLGLVRDANINLLRVWGGGLKEKRAFYDLCDELGILVWQEFPFAGAGVDYFPSDDAYLQLVRRESESIVRALRNHPSVALWCGGNEFIPRANRRLIHILRESVAKLDGTRPFKPASPSQDESHNWRVWHGGANTRDYEQDTALFFGEFGLQALPAPETLALFLPEEGLFPANQLWEYHNAEIEKLWRYANPIVLQRAMHARDETTEQALKNFVDASQEAQLRGLQVAIEYARRNKPRVGGCAFWQFNEPWYAISWSVVDYTRRPKRAYGKIKELYNPVLVCFAYPLRARGAGEIVSGQVWLINDLLKPCVGKLVARLNGEAIIELDVTIDPNTAQSIRALDLMLAEGENRLEFELRGTDLSATNEYDLNYCDRGEINSRRALLTRTAAWLRTTG